MDSRTAQKAKQGLKIWGQVYTWPVVAVTAVTVGSIGVLLSRKSKIEAGVPTTPEGEAAAVSPYGRKSAEQTGLMEGDRAYQGIFPAKKATEALEGILPATKPDSSSIEREPEKIKTTTPKSH